MPLKSLCYRFIRCLPFILVMICHCAYAQPAAVFSELEYRFETAVEGERIQHAFTVTNKGSSVLKILSASVSCSCTTVQFDQEPIAPGETGKIAVNFNTDGYGGRQARVDIAVVTNTPGSAPVQLTVSGKVDQLFTMTPAIVRLEGAAGEVLSRTVTIRPIPRYGLTIVKAAAQKGDHMRFELQEDHDGAQRIYRLNVEVCKKAQGIYFDKILLTTNNPVKPEIRVAVFAKIAG